MTADEMLERLARAIADPGAFVPRGSELRDGNVFYESVSRWSARAVQAACLPVHERQVREQVAKDIEAAAPKVTVLTSPAYAHRADGMRAAARIARGEQP